MFQVQVLWNGCWDQRFCVWNSQASKHIVEYNTCSIPNDFICFIGEDADEYFLCCGGPSYEESTLSVIYLLLRQYCTARFREL